MDAKAKEWRKKRYKAKPKLLTNNQAQTRCKYLRVSQISKRRNLFA